MKDIKELRSIIDSIDRELVDLLEKRMEIVEYIKNYKEVNNIPIEDKEREDELINKNLIYVKKSEYKIYIEKNLRDIIRVSKEMQNSNQ